MRILGIDPGLRITGYGCVEGDVIRPKIVEAGVFRLAGASPVPSVADRLVELHADLRALIERVEPSVIAVEGLFAHYGHPETAVKMAHGRGVILLVAKHMGLEIMEFKPAEVKKAATGSGRATKTQMQESIQALFGLETMPTPSDVADALAIGVCGLRRYEAQAGLSI